MLQIPRLYHVLHASKGYQGDAVGSAFGLHFTRIGAMSGYHYRCRGMLQIQRLYCVLHVSRWYQGIIMHADGCYEFKVGMVFYKPIRMLFYRYRGSIRVPSCMPRGAINSMFSLCFTRLEVIPGDHDGCRGMLRTQRCSVFYTLRGDVRVPLRMPRDTTNSTFVLRFTRIEAISGYHYEWRGTL